jgi:hypothetical protein
MFDKGLILEQGREEQEGASYNGDCENGDCEVLLRVFTGYPQIPPHRLQHYHTKTLAGLHLHE